MNEEQQTNMEAALSNARNRIPGDVVNRATADLPDNQRSAIRRLHDLYVTEDLSISDTAKLVGLSDAAVSLIFRGRYEAKLDGVVKTIEQYFDLRDKRAQGRKLAYIETSLTRKIWGLCDAALEFQKLAFIFSDAQIGKTTALLEYARAHNHGSTVYVRCPAGGGLLDFLTILAGILRISPNQSVTKLRERIIGAFDDRMLLIVDEAHQCIPDGTVRGDPKRHVRTVEFIRELFDRTECGLVICATNAFRSAMDAGAFHAILKQIKRRSLCSVQLPLRPTQEDLNAFAAKYGLPPSSGTARELEETVIDEEALGRWLTLLRMAAKVATQRKQPMEWAHVLSARKAQLHLEGR